MPQQARLFVAATPDEAALVHLDLAVGVARRLPGAPRWLGRERWHITVTFLGDVAESHMDALAGAVGTAVCDHPAVHLRLSGAGTFPSRGAPRVLWAGLDAAGRDGADLARLGRVARATARAARSLGVPVERRPFRPHLTLGRWRPADPADRRVAAALDGYLGPPFAVRELQLLRSHLGPQPRYEPVATLPLGG